MFGFKRNIVVETVERQITRLNVEIERLLEVVSEGERQYDVTLVERQKLREEVEQLQLTKKISEEDIKHMVKMKEEAADLDKQKYEVKLEGEKAKEIAEVKDEFQGKLQALLESQIKQGEARYKEILQRLPSVEVNLGNNDLIGKNKS